MSSAVLQAASSFTGFVSPLHGARDGNVARATIASTQDQEAVTMLDASTNTFRILLEDERTFFPGERITGCVIVPYVDLGAVSAIPIEIAARSTAGSRLLQDDNSDEQFTQSISSSRDIIFHDSKMLWSSRWKGKPAAESALGLTFSFEFTLPVEIPAITEDEREECSAKPIPPTFHDKDSRHSASVEYEITSSVVFKDPLMPQLQDQKTLKVRMRPRTRSELEEFHEMAARESIALSLQDSGNFLIKKLLRRKSDDGTFTFRIVLIRPKYLRFGHRMYYKALLLTDYPPSYFVTEAQPNRSVRRGEPPSRNTLFLRKVESSIVSYTNIKLEGYEASVYEKHPIYNQSSSLTFDMSKLVEFSNVNLPAVIQHPAKYMLDITQSLPALVIPSISPSFQTPNIQKVHLIKIALSFGTSQFGRDSETSELQSVIEVVNPGVDNAAANIEL